MEERENEGQLRIQFERGWVSKSAMSGNALLELVVDGSRDEPKGRESWIEQKKQAAEHAHTAAMLGVKDKERKGHVVAKGVAKGAEGL